MYACFSQLLHTLLSLLVCSAASSVQESENTRINTYSVLTNTLSFSLAVSERLFGFTHIYRIRNSYFHAHLFQFGFIMVHVLLQHTDVKI